MILNLEMIPSSRHEQARAAFETGDAAGFVSSVNNGRALTLVSHNVSALRERDIYERSLLLAYSSLRTNFRRLPLGVLRDMFELADRARLRAASDPLPSEGTFTLYRGVAGSGKARRVRGLSWTALRTKAWWFAKRLPHLADPAVFRATVSAEHVLAYIADRDEQEFLVWLPSSVRLIRENKE